jgi:hypothetical protein
MIFSIRFIVSIFSFLSLTPQVQCQLITITQRVDNCRFTPSAQSASFIGNPRLSVLNAASVTLEDPDFNTGLPFLILVHQLDMSGWIRRRQAAVQNSWLMQNGNTTVDCARAAQFTIKDSQLLVDGAHVSTEYGVLSMPFAPSIKTGAVSTNFTVIDNALHWKHPEFTEGIAQFYKLPPGLLENALVLAKFIGSMRRRRGWSPISLVPIRSMSFVFYVDSTR